MNKVLLIGRLGQDARFENIGGTDCIIFSIATSEKYKDKQGNIQEVTEWHSCQKWNGTLKQAEILKKGTQIGIEGKITYTKKEDKFFTNIRVDKIELLSTLEKTQTQKEPESISVQEIKDDLPF